MNGIEEPQHAYLMVSYKGDMYEVGVSYLQLDTVNISGNEAVTERSFQIYDIEREVDVKDSVVRVALTKYILKQKPSC